MATTTQRTLQDRTGALSRMINALGRDLDEWDPADLRAIKGLEDELALLRTRVVLGLRDRGVSDGRIGDALGVTQQAVSKRWPGGGRYVGAAGRYRKSPRRDTQ
jgi:hypothetical protein